MHAVRHHPQLRITNALRMDALASGLFHRSSLDKRSTNGALGMDAPPWRSCATRAEFSGNAS